jgi:hypothetical protein
MTSFYIQITLKRDIHREFYTLLINLCLEIAVDSILCAMKAVLYMFRFKFLIFYNRIAIFTSVLQAN